ncbi:UDP-glycosyltransferase 88B1-like [Silene latifolia]|uniref:UDP-glycosyltransferase 88B1-like n=1 Tax=Silene latifolia TaxID=37657 RepID=UPI003D76E57E
METIVIYPAPGFSHLISVVELAKLLLHHSHNSETSITFLLPSFPSINTTLFTSFIASVTSDFPSISFNTLPHIPLSKPTSEYPNPEAILFENLRSNNTNILNALTSIALTSSISSFIVDFFCYSSLDVSRSLNIPSYFFFTSGAYALSFFINFPEFDKVEKDSFRNVDTVFEIPGLLEVPSSHMLEPMLDRGVSYDDFIRVGEAMVKADGIIINTFDALEVKAVEGLRQGTCLPGAPIPPIYCIGPLIVTKVEDKADACLNWLDSQPSQSVVYLNFGSYGRFSKDQLMEIALGLERSMVRFLWVVREPNPPSLDSVKQFTPSHELDLDPLLPEGFLDRTKERGIVVKSWAPQIEVLRHESVGGFVTHCGWNSILEAVSFGVPMVAWPLYAEQRFNKIVLVEALKIALPMDESSDRFVRSDEVERRIKQLMGSEKGNAMRKCVLELKDRAKDALNEDGSSTVSLAKLVESWKRA